MVVSSITVLNLIDVYGDTVELNIDAASLTSLYTSEAISAMSEGEFYDAAIEYILSYTDVVDVSEAKIGTAYYSDL